MKSGRFSRRLGGMLSGVKCRLNDRTNKLVFIKTQTTIKIPDNKFTFGVGCAVIGC
jgi:hypothetical protein